MVRGGDIVMVKCNQQFGQIDHYWKKHLVRPSDFLHLRKCCSCNECDRGKGITSWKSTGLAQQETLTDEANKNFLGHFFKYILIYY